MMSTAETKAFSFKCTIGGVVVSSQLGPSCGHRWACCGQITSTTSIARPFIAATDKKWPSHDVCYFSKTRRAEAWAGCPPPESGAPSPPGRTLARNLIVLLAIRARYEPIWPGGSDRRNVSTLVRRTGRESTMFLRAPWLIPSGNFRQAGSTLGHDRVGFLARY